MRNGLILLFAVAVLTPLLVSAWLSQRVIGRLDSELREQVEARINGQMDRYLASVGSLIEEYQHDLDELLRKMPHDARSIRHLQRTDPTVDNIIRVDGRSGDVLHPPLLDSMTPEETSFLRRTRELWDSRPRPVFPEAGADSTTEYWSSFFWGHGLQLIRWRTESDGNMVGAHLRRSRVLADIITVMPDGAGTGTEGVPDFYCIADAKGEVVYTWGRTCGTSEGLPPVSTRALPAPLAAWKLEGSMAVEAATSKIQLSLLLTSLIGVAVCAAGLFYYRSSSEMRRAEQRVTFVNQVSHELKTPLTNLRLYADLLRDRLPAERSDLIRFANVMVSEGERLTRLVHNVLTFGRGQRDGHVIHPSRIVPDDVVSQVVERFSPSLNSRGLDPELDLDASDEHCLDADVLIQAVGNLLSNAEKYAPNTSLVIRTRSNDGLFAVEVEDSGPGVREQDRHRIFQPFVRGSDSLTEGVSGAGIGLALTRDLARAHGGDLILEPREPGVRFCLTLQSRDGE